MKKVFFSPLFLVISAWLISFPACYKNDSPPPAPPDPCPWPDITAEGRNTFGCKINGKEWVPCVNPWLWLVSTRPMDCTVRESDGSNFLSIVLNRAIEDSTYSNPPLDGSFIVGFKPCAIGQIDINNGLEYVSAKLFADWESTSYEGIDTSAYNFLNVIRLDTSANIISGQFQITLLDGQSGKKAKITDGRFDIKYYPQ